MRYEAPKTLDQAVDIYSNFNGLKRVLAGGTDVLVQMRSEIIKPEMVMDIKNIQSLKRIEVIDGYWRIGAAVSAATITSNKPFISDWPGISEAVGLIGSTQIQSRATLVGNLSNASPAADSVPALVAANARVDIVGKGGKRSMDIFSLIQGPGKLNIRPDEFISHICIPVQQVNGADSYLRFIPRTEMDIAVVGCGVCLEVNDEVVTSVRIVLGAVGPKVIVAHDAAKLVSGSKLENEVLEGTQTLCQEIVDPIDDKRGTIVFRRKVAGVLAKRALKRAFARAES